PVDVPVEDRRVEIADREERVVYRSGVVERRGHEVTTGGVGREREVTQTGHEAVGWHPVGPSFTASDPPRAAAPLPGTAVIARARTMIARVDRALMMLRSIGASFVRRRVRP